MGPVEEVVGRIARREVPGWAPQPGPQYAALACPAFETLYGGAAGGGKSDTGLAAAVRLAGEKHYKGVVFRRTYPELEEIIDRAREIIPIAVPGAREIQTRHEWRFPAGGKLIFRHLADYAAAQAHKSAEYAFEFFDELTTFEERQYRYLMSRARNSKGLPVRIFAATNPGGPGADWVLKRWAPWLDPDSEKKAVPGEILHYLTHPETGEDVWVPDGTPGALSRTFIPAKLDDNKVLEESDPGYRARLRAQDPLTRKQLEEGDWLARPAAGLFFKREWAPVVSESPDKARRLRFWDRAATEATQGRDPDWTVGLLIARSGDGLFWIEDVVRFRAGPGAVKAKILATAALDGPEVEIGFTQDPGQAGVFEANEYVSALAGYAVRPFRETGDKVTRAKAVSAQFAPRPGQKWGAFRLVSGAWNKALIAELEEFPDGAHDDQVDALSGAFAVITGMANLGKMLGAMRAAMKNRPARPPRSTW